MIQRAVTAIIGVVIGLFATFAVFGTVLAGLDDFYLLTQGTCAHGDENNPTRFVRAVGVNAEGNYLTTDLEPTDNLVDWSDQFATTLIQGTTDPDLCMVAPGTRGLPGTLPPGGPAMLPDGSFIFMFTGRGPGQEISSIHSNPPLRWVEAEEVFTAQGQLVTLLAVIAALGMPLGAMTAVVFFGQAVVSSGVSGQGASQVLVAIAAVVIILVAVQMFQQFAGYLGDAFDAVNGDRFVVFDDTLGSLAETIAEFWGVLAFAGLINIATIVWRNYNGNMSIGGLGDQAGGGRGL